MSDKDGTDRKKEDIKPELAHAKEEESPAAHDKAIQTEGGKVDAKHDIAKPPSSSPESSEATPGAAASHDSEPSAEIPTHPPITDEGETVHWRPRGRPSGPSSKPPPKPRPK